MSVVVRSVAVAGGALVVAVTLTSALQATVLPRGVPNRMSRLATGAARVAFRLRARRITSYEGRDRVMAMLAPAALITLLAMWITMLLGGYLLIYLGATSVPAGVALELSGSSLFTLGTTRPPGLGGSLVSYTEAGLGLLVLTLMITFLPSIYGAFSRRENGVGLLRVRAGVPPRASVALIRYHRIDGAHYRLTELWRAWEPWFVDIEETHTTFPILAFFRSPQPHQSWVTAAGALLDTASFWVAAVQHPADPDAQLCIRAGFQALRRIGEVFGLPFDDDPPPDGPISVDRSEWDAAMDEMAAAGVPLVAERDQAWAAWRGWRVNYDQVLLELARLVEAPPAPWLSDRSPLGARLGERGTTAWTPDRPRGRGRRRR